MEVTFLNISQEKQNRIRTVAMEEFATHGYEQASTNRIVKTLGVSKGSLFKYFRTKGVLYTYLVSYATTALVDHLETQVTGPLYEKGLTSLSWREKLLAYGEVELRYLQADPLTYRFFYRLVKDIRLPALQPISKQLQEEATAYFQQMNIILDLPPLLLHHVGFVIQGYNEQFFHLHGFEGYTDETITNYLDGIKAHLDLVKD